jgi:hypothetical protein
VTKPLEATATPYDEVPRGAAHAWAAVGHIRNANDRLEAQAREHAERSIP